MKFSKRVFLLIVITIAGLGLGISGCNNKAGDTAPQITGKLVNGKPFQLSDLKGKFVVLHFWASWCGPCRKENPIMVELYRKFGDKVEFVTVALEKDDDKWQSVVKKENMNWPYQIVENHMVILTSSNALAYGVTSIPATFLIRPDGSLMSKFHVKQLDAVLTAETSE